MKKILMAKIITSITLGCLLAYPASLLGKPLVFLMVTTCVCIGFNAWKE